MKTLDQAIDEVNAAIEELESQKEAMVAAALRLREKLFTQEALNKMARISTQE